MNRTLLLTMVFLVVMSSAYAFEGNTSEAYIKGEFVYDAGIETTNQSDIYWEMTQLPTSIRGSSDGGLVYVGFYPLQDSYTYYIPFDNGTFSFFCNPSDVNVGRTIVCTGILRDVNGSAINDARIDYYLYSFNGTLFVSGEWEFVNNGVYKLSIAVSTTDNFTDGDYYLIFSSSGFEVDYAFPISLTFGEDTGLTLGFWFSTLLLVSGIILSIYGYLRGSLIIFVMGSSLLLISGLMMFSWESVINDTTYEVTTNTTYGMAFISPNKQLSFGISITIMLSAVIMMLSFFLQRIRKGEEDE